MLAETLRIGVPQRCHARIVEMAVITRRVLRVDDLAGTMNRIILPDELMHTPQIVEVFCGQGRPWPMAVPWTQPAKLARHVGHYAFLACCEKTRKIFLDHLSNQVRQAEHLAHLGKRLGEVPEFAAYAIADGIRRAFTRFGKWVRTAADTIAKAPDAPAIQLLPGFAELLDTDDG